MSGVSADSSATVSWARWAWALSCWKVKSPETERIVTAVWKNWKCRKGNTGFLRNLASTTEIGMSYCMCKISFKSVQVCGCYCTTFRRLTFLGHSVLYMLRTDRPTDLLFGKISNGDISARSHPTHFMFGSTVGFSRLVDRMALFRVGPHSISMYEKMMPEEFFRWSQSKVFFAYNNYKNNQCPAFDIFRR